MNRYGTFTTLAACTALALSGCAGSGHDLYGGEQTADDVLPDDVAVDDDDWDTSTSRLLASHDGHDFYVFASSTGDDCLMTYDPQSPGAWVVGCGPAGPTGVRAKFDLEGLPEETPAGWIRLTPELEVTGT